MKNGVDEDVAERAVLAMWAAMTPDVPDDLPFSPAQILWLLDAVAGPLAFVVDRSPNEPDLQYALNVFAKLQGTPNIWGIYPPWVVAAVIVAMAYRFRIAVYNGNSVVQWAHAIHLRYEYAARLQMSGPMSQLFEWLVHRRRDVLKHFLMRLEDSARGLGPDEGFRISIPTLNVGFDVIA